MILNLSDPVPHVVEAILASAVVSEDDSLSSSVIGLSDSSKSLLAGCIPDLDLYCFTV